MVVLCRDGLGRVYSSRDSAMDMDPASDGLCVPT